MSPQDSTANSVAISAVAIAGADNPYAVAVNEVTRFAGYLRVYGLPQGQDNHPTPIGSATNAIANAAAKLGLPTTGPAGSGGFSMPASGQLDGPGAPGGYDAGPMHTAAVANEQAAERPRRHVLTRLLHK